MAVQAIRLASRFPDLRVYLASTASTSPVDFSIVARLYNFPISLELDTDAPQDVWERAAELIHESYSAQTDRTKPACRPWKELAKFYKQSNRRQVHNALWMVETIADHTGNSLESGSAAPLPPRFMGLEPLEQLSILGFDEHTVERMIQAEHEDWRKYYEQHGWKYSEIRDDARRRHDKLLPWDELVNRHPEFRRDACRSLASTLRNLRALGYRSMPKVSTTSGRGSENVS
jgi:RyR domain